MPTVAERLTPATIRDVADRAGVSTATVSRVLAGIGRPRPETVAAVRNAAAELGYRPSAVARSLRMQRTRTLGLIVTDIQNPFFPELVRAAEVAARAVGYSVLLGSAAYDEHRTTHYLDLMVDHRVDGLIIASSQVSEESLRWLVASPVPVVIVNAEPSGIPLAMIASDNQAGMEMVVKHLVSLGHRRIAYVRGRPSFTADEPRLEGFRRVARAAGIAAADAPELESDGLVGGGEAAVGRLLASRDDITAVACYNDVTAIGVLRGLRDAGRRVPDQVSITGCDDIDAASWVVPALTTAAQQKAAMGRLAVERIVAVLDDPDTAGPPSTTTLPMTLMIRESTGPVPAR
jgi:LacI family transcriptional regulator